MKDRQTEEKPAGVPEKAKQAGDIWGRWNWVEPSVWTGRMLTALDEGVKGGIPSLLSKGCSHYPQPLQKPVNPLRGEPPTGEPAAGDPHVRFGGGRGWELNQPFLPYRIFFP